MRLWRRPRGTSRCASRRARPRSPAPANPCLRRLRHTPQPPNPTPPPRTRLQFVMSRTRSPLHTATRSSQASSTPSSAVRLRESVQAVSACGSRLRLSLPGGGEERGGEV
jgi:hypothetical protein